MRFPLICFLALFALPACLPQETDPPEDQGTVPGSPTWHEHVGPLVKAKCSSCHSAGNIGPFPLETYDDVVTYSGAARVAVEDRRMPPWHVDESGDCNTFRDSRRLTDVQIATIGRWIDQGMALGDPELAPPPPSSGPELSEVNSTVDPGAEYAPNADLADDYRCFLVDPGVADDSFLTAYEVKPGAPSVVHHVILYSLDTATDEAIAESLDDGEAGDGYTCFGGSGVSTSRPLVVWAPGTGPTLYPQGTGLRMVGGRKAVMQVHYSLAAGSKPDRTTIDLQYRSSVDKEAIITSTYDLDLNLDPGQAKAEEGSSITLPPYLASVQIHGVYPHMHKLGRSLRVDLGELAGNSCLIDVPDYEFNWQQFYFYDEPVILEPGPSVLSIACSYDTRGVDKPVYWGEGTSDEMCIAAFYVSY
ncbi:MAG: hypothetical protein WKG00_37050 [Polyangiaceae bacterium]